MSALLKRDYAGAWDAFTAAQALSPDDPKVRANLKRLRDMGHGNERRDAS